MFIRSIARVASATLFVALLVAPALVRAQETGERWPRWWYGVYGGANINMFSGAVHDLASTPGTGTSVADTTGFNAGSGLGLALGGILEYNSGDLLGGNLFVGYDNRSIGFDTKMSVVDGDTTRTNEQLDAHVAYVTIEPNVRINLGNKFFHLMLGPSFRILVAKSFDYAFTSSGDTAASALTGDFPNIRSFVVGAQGGLGYDIPLSSPQANTQVLLTPFAQFHLTQGLLDDPAGRNTFKVNSVRAGVELKFGSVPPPTDKPTDGTASADFTVRAPNVITESRRLNETFPMRNYVFFDAGSTELPERYKRVASGEAFSESQLVKPAPETGNNDAMAMRSRRQMEVYYNVINVFADRLRNNPSATVKLTGSANGDAGTGRKMAESVKNYMTTTFGIDGSRITTQASAMPAHRSGSGSSQGEDKKLIEAENYRVEIEGQPDDIMKPVTINSIQEEPIDNDIVVSIPERDDVAYWNVDVTDRDGNKRTFGPYGKTTVARINSKDLLGSAREGRYTSKIVLTTKSNQTVESPEREFRLVRADADEEQTGTRYSILFEFDDSKTVQTYENFLVSTVVPAIPNGASVIIHGHTDVTGDPDYNTKLSQRRSDEVQKILTRELTKAGKTVTFDTYGFGEDERRSPFNNTMPEQRYYNRTVVIEIVPTR